MRVRVCVCACECLCVYVFCVRGVSFNMSVRMVYLLTWVYVWCIFLCFEQNRLKIQTRLD